MNIYLIIILTAIIGRYLLDLASDYLNVKNIQDKLPDEFKDWYDAEKYTSSQRYLRDCTRFGIVNDSFHVVVTLALILAGGFNLVDQAARSLELNSISTGLLFAGILMLANIIIGIPFSVYSTFVIEEKYGFNKTTKRTFVIDIIKSLVLMMIIGGAVFALIILIFEKSGPLAWFYCWLAVTSIQIFLMFIAPYVIMPLFNKYEPLEDGELKSSIENYAHDQNFKMKGVFKMDGSKRSSKSNAFFTGFGKSRRIVLFDTLIAKHSVDELVSVLAHEMGHYKKKHIIQSIIRSIAMTGFMFYLLSLILNNQGLFDAFRMESLSVYASLFFFGFLYAPISMITSIIESVISRKHEYEADRYAAETRQDPDSMITALKKLSVDNLSNLTPHPFTVFISYSHPPVLERIKALRTIRNDDCA